MALNIDPDILTKAWDGDANSQLLLGKAYFNSVYTKENCSDAFKWICRSAEQGNMEAQYRLGDLLALGQGTCKSYTEAYKWYTKAALQGYKKALIRIFNLYQQDKKMHCRGKLNSQEGKWTGSSFLKSNRVKELNEYRLKHHESKLNHAISYYTDLFNVLKSRNTEDSDTSIKLGFLYQYGYGVKKCIKLAMDYYTEAAEHGNRDAQYHLGFLYEHDTDIKFNYRKAIHWYRTSATSGNIAAQNALGYFYEKGLATELNLEDTIYWYTKAANAGHSDAQLALGRLYRKGEGVELDISQAIKWYSLAASQGSGAAQNCLNQLYQLGKIAQLSGIESNTDYVGEHQTKQTLRSKLQDDIEKMNGLPHIKQLTKLAEHALRTDGNAMFTLGMKYYNGQDFTQDKDTGFRWIKKAAKTGLQEAELKVAEMYYDGSDVVDQDYHESSIWTTKVVMKKNSKAQCDLGLLYLYGEGVRNDPLEASKWFTKSADQENAEAQYQLGLLRFEGLALRKDTEEALEWFNKSGLGRNTKALYHLGDLYEVGRCFEKPSCLKKGKCVEKNICVQKNVCRAIKMYEYSANNGHVPSQYLMAEFYEYGDPVEQDLQKSYKYYKLAVNYSAEVKYKLARGHMLGTFGNEDGIKAFELFKEIADDEPSSKYNILQTPIPYRDPDMVYTKLVDMFKLVSDQGKHETCYNIGYMYENGTHRWSEALFHPSYTDAIQWYSAAATNGDSRAQYRLGLMYEEGKGVQVDLSVAYDYYSEAYKNGIDDAGYRLALMYLNGEVTAQDFLKAYYLFTEASNRGHKKAYKQLIPSEISDNLKMLEAVANAGYVAVQYQLGIFYQEERENDEEALKWLSLASNGGVTDAFYRLGVIYEERKGNNQNYSKAIQLYSEAIKKDHEGAMYRLAQIYHLGKGVKRDYQKAYGLYSRAEKLGHNKSSRLLDITNDSVGHSFKENGKAKVIKYSEDFKDTLLMMKSIAKRGNSDVQYNLGTFYMTNKSHLNYNEAFKWYQMAASKENTDAIYQLGLLYENGQGTIQNYSMAYRLYTQAKEKEHRNAIYRLGIAYQYGSGVEINTSEAIDCFIKAAELGSNESQYKLGKLYESGDLVEKDTLKALKWYTKAYINGNCDVFQNLYQLYEEKPLESYFYERLFSILSNIEKIDIPYKGRLTNILLYGSFYFKLGMMYLEGRGTAENLVKALKQFLKAYYDYGYGDAQPFISVKYSPNSLVFLGDYFDKLEAYIKIGDEIPAIHQYKLGMLYYRGLQYVSMEGDSSNDPTIITVLESNYRQAYKYFELASKKRHAKSQEQVALMYLRGDYVKRDDRIAFERFATASELMSTRDCSARGMDFYHGHNVEQNHKVAKIYLQKAAIMRDNKAQTCLDKIQLDEIEKEQRKSSNTINRFEEEIENMDPDLLYERGVQLYKGSSEGVKNYDLSLFYIRKTAEKNHNQAMAQLGKMYLDGKAVEKDEKEAMKWIEKSIKGMDSYECYEQGMIFYNDKNYKISSLYLKKGAKESHGHAQAQLGLIYLQGLAVEKNHKQAMKWIKRSVMQLNSNSCEENGLEFYDNVEVDNNYDIALLYLRNAAEENSPIAQAQLGIMYLHGLGVERNYNVAKEWIKSSIKNMDESDCYDYGMKFRNGIEVEKDYTIALTFLRKAANQSHGLAQAQLGLMYLDGQGVSKNKPKGMEWIKKSIISMEQTDCYNLGHHLYNQYESEERLGITYMFMKKLAAKAHVLAKALLGDMFLEGKGVQKNEKEALKWFKHCVKTLDSSKCYDQGMKYYNGAGVETNYEIAMLYLQVAKLKKYALAQVQVGVMYLEGHGIEKDKEKAMACFQQSINEMKPKDCYLQGMALYKEHRYDISLLFIRRAAEEGHDLAQSQLGIMLLEGKAIPKNQAEPIEWIEKSLESMSPHDCYAQGMALYCGTMVAKNYAISLRFMEKAADNHYGLAQAHMALFYYQGLGVDKSKDKALEWVEKSIIELRVEDCNEDECNDDKWYGYEDECYTQGIKFYDGTEVDPDYEIALLYLRKAAERYHGPSQAQLALMYLEGSGVEKNYGVTMELIDKSMNNMELDECYRQGMIFYHKTELENNYDIALQYLQKASKANAYAQAQLGYMYKNGIGVDINQEEAARWYNMVENNYIGDSRYYRSKIHHYDQGGMQDFSKAFKLYQEELGFPDVNDELPNNADALRGIGLLHEYGDGVTQDFKRAMEYYKRSILDEENVAAYYNIGLLYYYGKGVDQNYKEALLWFEKEANTYIDSQALHVFVQDDTNEASDGSSKRKYSLVPDSRIIGESHYYTGLMYRNGYGVDQDEERAQNYFKMAHIHGIKRAKEYLG